MGSRCACKVFMASLVDGDLQVIADEVATLWNMYVFARACLLLGFFICAVVSVCCLARGD